MYGSFDSTRVKLSIALLNMIRRFDRQHLTHLGLFLDPPDLGFAWWCVENPGSKEPASARRGLKTCTPLPPIPKERTPPVGAYACAYTRTYSRPVVRTSSYSLFVRVRTRCSYEFARCSYEFAYAARALFVRCSYEFARARTHPRTTRRARLLSALISYIRTVDQKFYRRCTRRV